MNNFTAEIIGTAILILLGNGVVANTILAKTKGNTDGWLQITFGWGMAVFVAAFVVGQFSGAHLNPAVTLGLVAAGKFSISQAPAYILAQMIGAALGAALVYLTYRQHYAATDDADAKLGTFATGPAIRSNADNLFSEIIGTFLLIFAILYIVGPESGIGSLESLPVGLVVFAIGMSLGGTTGYAINPARDLGPRIMHAILPIPGKRDSDWSYSWIPVVGPIVGGVLAGLLFTVL